MKFIHTADWHLGKVVNGASMLEDQRFILQKLIKLIESEKPDALVIAGDLYDRSVPPASAVTLLNEVLFKINVEMNVPVIAISGNHDSADRLAFGSTWFRQNRFYLAGKLEKNMYCPTVEGVAFHCFPYAEPGTVRHLFDDPTVHTHHEAMKRLTGEAAGKMDPDLTHVAVGHSFVTGGETSDSERLLSVGGTGNVGAELFAAFHYTALGHLHNPNAIGHKAVKYAGSILKYSFSEAAHIKSVAVVETDEKKQVNVRRETLLPLRDMKVLTGFFDELMEQPPTDDYVKIVLKDEGTLLDPMTKLKRVYPNVLHLEKNVQAPGRFAPSVRPANRQEDISLFGEFYQVMTGLDFSMDKKKYMMSVMKEAEKEEWDA